MTVHNHAVVWIDHRVAKVFYLGLETSDERTIRADLATEHLHHKANTIGSGNALEDPTFFPRIGEALESSEAILIVGPGNEKTLLLKISRGAAAIPSRDVSSGRRPAITRPIAKSLRWAAAISIWVSPRVEAILALLDVPQCPAWRWTIAFQPQDRRLSCQSILKQLQ